MPNPRLIEVIERLNVRNVPAAALAECQQQMGRTTRSKAICQAVADWPKLKAQNLRLGKRLREIERAIIAIDEAQHEQGEAQRMLAEAKALTATRIDRLIDIATAIDGSGQDGQKRRNPARTVA